MGNEKLELEIGINSNFQLEIGRRTTRKQKEIGPDSTQHKICLVGTKMSVSSSHGARRNDMGCQLQNHKSQAGGAAVQLNFNLT